MRCKGGSFMEHAGNILNTPFAKRLHNLFWNYSIIVYVKL